MEQVILVNEQDQTVGVEEKLQAHRDGGRLHRAFSIFIRDPAGRMLLQLRSQRKYHSGGLWTNTCCGHPKPGEETVAAARRRLVEEMGIVAPLVKVSSFVYRAVDTSSGLTEYEYDHVFLGTFEGKPRPDSAEVDGYRWMEPSAIASDLERNPCRYSPWFPLAFATASGLLPVVPTALARTNQRAVQWPGGGGPALTLTGPKLKYQERSDDRA